jgi:small subunit ribosomal protein S5
MLEKREQGAELIEKLVYVGRCVKVVKGGRKFSFSALVVVGDGKGRIGLGHGRGIEVADAKTKAFESAKKNMFRIPLRDSRTLHHDIKGRYCASSVVMRAAPSGTGIIAGGPIRAVFEALGVKDVVAKAVGSCNPHNIIKAAFDALTAIHPPKAVADKRGKKVTEIVHVREAKLAGKKGAEKEEGTVKAKADKAEANLSKEKVSAKKPTKSATTTKESASKK